MQRRRLEDDDGFQPLPSQSSIIFIITIIIEIIIIIIALLISIITTIIIIIIIIDVNRVTVSHGAGHCLGLDLLDLRACHNGRHAHHASELQGA